MDDYEFCNIHDYLEPEQGDGVFDMNEMASAIEETIKLKANNTVMNVTPKLIKSWVPGKKFAVGKRFMGYPSHVDNNGIIYVQPRDCLDLLDEMNKKISRYYEDLVFINKIRNVKTSFKIGDCVIARYMTDMKFYRAVIENIKDDEYRVQYVDYGTREYIKSTEMYSMVIGENIPVCALTFVLTDILPRRALRWNKEEIGFFHSRLADNLCNVKIETECPQYDDIQGVAIEVLQQNKQIEDIAKQAVYEGYGRTRKVSSDEPWPIEFTFPEPDLPDDDGKVTDAKRDRKVNPHYYEASIPITGKEVT